MEYIQGFPGCFSLSARIKSHTQRSLQEYSLYTRVELCFRKYSNNGQPNGNLILVITRRKMFFKAFQSKNIFSSKDGAFACCYKIKWSRLQSKRIH